MSDSPEIGKESLSLIEAEEILLGALARTTLMNAILEAENARKPIPKLGPLKTYFNYLNHKLVTEAFSVFRSLWEKETGEELKLPEKSTPGKRNQLVKQTIINPLKEIYTRIEGQSPQPGEPWLGRFLIKSVQAEESQIPQPMGLLLGRPLIEATREKPAILEVSYFLNQFGLDPKILVEEVFQTLDRQLETS